MDEIIRLTPEEKLILQEEKLDTSTTKLATKIIRTRDVNKVKDLTAEFNLAQVKKNVLRTKKFNDLLDQISDKMSERFEKRPDEFSNKDLIEYLKVTQEVLDKSSKSIKDVNTVDAIQVNQQNVNININDGMSRESREKVMDAVNSILARIESEKAQVNIVDSTSEENIEYEVEDIKESNLESLLNEEE